MRTDRAGRNRNEEAQVVSDLKEKWAEQRQAVKLVIGLTAVVVAVVVVVKIAPALIAGMGIAAFVAILFVPYWIPTIVAFHRKHPSKGGILGLNFFLGWTFIGWVLSLVWALSDNTTRAGGTHSVVVNATVQAGAPLVGGQYQAGDVVNGHRFDGVSWTPIQAPPPAAPTSPPWQPASVATAGNVALPEAPALITE
jgi:hypothetical protein